MEKEQAKKKTFKKTFKKICRKVGVTLRDQKMLEPNDHILVGLSGGKDSMILLETLAERRNALPFNFNITAAHINVTNIDYMANIAEMESICKEWSVNFILKETPIELAKDKKKTLCFACSWQRRKALFELSNELNCNKIALGHHRYDALETLLINMIYHGSISSLPYELNMFDEKIKLIRPLLDMDENLLKEYSKLRAYNTEDKKCPNEENNKRKDIRELINSIEQLHGKGSYNMYKSMDKIFDEYLPQKKTRTS
jgi:tRNA(Ile)-lysidine synthetase-like protein